MTDRDFFIKQLYSKAKFYSKYLWDRDFDVELKINNRLTRTYAWFIEGDNCIEFSKILLNVDNQYFIDEILIHELCHWHCYKLGINNDDGSVEFETEIFKSGSRSTEMNSIENNKVFLFDDKQWFFCKKCDTEKEVYKISTSERINCFYEREKHTPNCPKCNEHLTYYSDVYHRNTNKVPYYPREQLVKLHEQYCNSISTKID